LLILLMFLLQPLACFAHPCTSSLKHQDVVDTSDDSGNRLPFHQDSDGCDSAVCCSEYIHFGFRAMLVSETLVSVALVSGQHPRLPTIVIPIFIPPQNFT
jgi:hypothetical protein